MKSRAEQLDEMSEAILLATDRIRYYKQQDKMLQSEIKRLTRNERTHRLCTRGGMIEAFIKSFPGDCTNSTLFCAMFRIVVFNSFFSFAAWELIVYPPCNELGSLFITRAVFSKALLKTAAHFSCFVKLFLRFFKRKIPRTFFWYEVFFLSSYLNDIAARRVDVYLFSQPRFGAFFFETLAGDCLIRRPGLPGRRAPHSSVSPPDCRSPPRRG